MKRLLILGVFASGIMACNSEKHVDKEVLEEVNQSMEIKKVSEVDILNKAMEWGDEISGAAQEELMTKLLSTIEEKGVSEAIAFCNVEALPGLKKLSDDYGVKIRRVSHDYRNPEDQPGEMEEMLLQAYEYNEENDIANTTNVQELPGGEVLLYTKAIKIPGKLCLNCHGAPGKDITEETLAKLNELYPEDKAKGHEVGDLRGMWSIAIPKKEVVKKL
ncbi:DUF3365 domain-containing protein [Echinicola marina]|uniref:Tll0287-like domain-containing protein n=1 Tax=Echinicola marina TaxID=2859768 RepID=UPI001CF62312|nr:DUF3365 domain-containing protein [Echinicola marina]UCS94765.1 DUF3365 domain-containing protein [Echinicola marina]